MEQCRRIQCGELLTRPRFPLGRKRSLLMSDEGNDEKNDEEITEKELVISLVKSLVDNPDKVSVDLVKGERSTILELRVEKEDIGKVIGKQGRIAAAIRTLVGASASKNGRRIVLEIID